MKPVSGSGTPTAASFNMAGADLALMYDVTNEKFGLQWFVTGDTEATVWQTGTTPLGTYPAVADAGPDELRRCGMRTGGSRPAPATATKRRRLT